MGIIFIVVILLLIFMFIYTIKCFTMLNFIKKIKNKILRIVVSIIPILLIFLLFNFVNFVVILFHTFIFLSLSQLVIFIIKKIKKKKLNNDIFVILGVSITFVYMCIGAFLCYHVFETKYEVTTNKNIGTDSFRIIQISDSHVGATFDGDGLKKHIEKISKIDSDIVVITGDFVDDDTTREDMIKSCEALTLFKPKYGIYYINGNHDKGYYNSRNFTYEELTNELKKNNIIVLEDEVKEIDDYFYIIGRKDKTYNRKTIKELTENLDKTKYMIDLNHQPNDYENEKKEKIDLVLSGHTHGGQLFPLGYVGLLINANDMFKGIKTIDNTTFIVNTGISDWAIDFKTGTKSEYTVIDIINKKGE